MPIIIALAGNPNCGKTTLFNRLTGSARHVGNWSGVTVDVKTDRLLSRFQSDAAIADLPGMYSLVPHSADEAAASDYLHQHPPDVILNILDATALERGLLLTLQLFSLGRPMVLALNMTDELCAQGASIDVTKLERLLGVPVVSICARDGRGVKRLVRCAVETVPSPIPAAPALDASQIARQCCVGRLHDRFTRRIDSILLHPVLSLPLTGLLLAFVFFVAFGPVGSALSDLVSAGCEQASDVISRLLMRMGITGPLHGLITEGALGGALSVLGFLPMILLLFGMLSMLEDSGVMARLAFVLDRPLSRIGLDGRCFLPLMLGFGCSVPAVMCARGMPCPSQRRLTILLVPFMSCSAKAPVYALFAHVFFPCHRLLAICVSYALGMLASIGTGRLALRLCPSLRDPGFILDLPRYRLPTLRTTAMLMREKAYDFLRRAFGVVCLSSAVVWFLRTFSPQLRIASSVEGSLLGGFADLVSPLFRPAGFDRPEAAAAVLSGLIAKENIIGTLHVLTQGDIASAFPSSLCAAAFLVFTALYAPCIAAFAAMRRELGFPRALSYVSFHTIFAWCAAVIIFQLGRLAGL